MVIWLIGFLIVWGILMVSDDNNDLKWYHVFPFFVVWPFLIGNILNDIHNFVTDKKKEVD